METPQYTAAMVGFEAASAALEEAKRLHKEVVRLMFVAVTGVEEVVTREHCDDSDVPFGEGHHECCINTAVYRRGDGWYSRPHTPVWGELIPATERDGMDLVTALHKRLSKHGKISFAMRTSSILVPGGYAYDNEYTVVYVDMIDDIWVARFEGEDGGIYVIASTVELGDMCCALKMWAHSEFREFAVDFSGM